MTRESPINFLIPQTKNFKISIFHELFFPKCNFKITCIDDICLPLCPELNERSLTIKEKKP